jgi:NADH-quinone oxidoreductase subunit A
VINHRLRKGAGSESLRRNRDLARDCLGFVALTILTSVLVGPGRFNRAKYDSYECGIEPTPQPVGGGRFPVKYYITAMLFIVFDIEIVFSYPWAVAFDQMGSSPSSK